MSIDTGQSLTFNPNFPVPGINQSSQPFRDNYQVIKTAIENLQGAQATNNSILSLVNVLDTATGLVRFDVQYKNNALILPNGTPNGPPSPGMIRYLLGNVEYYDGLSWTALLSSNQVFGGQIKITQDPVADDDAVPLGYLNRRFDEFQPLTDAVPASAFTGGNQQGVYLTYDPTRQKIDIVPRDFFITLTGPVRGSAIVSGLGDVTIATTTDFIAGITVQDEGVSLGPVGSVTYLNFIGQGVTATQNGQVAVINMPSALTTQDVRNEVGNFVKGTARDPNTNLPTETGIIVNYDSANNALELSVREFNVNLTGAVTGTGRVRRLNDVTISTTTELIRGMNVQSEGVALGGTETVRTLNFTGGAVSVTQSGSQATIDIPVSLTDTDVRDTVARTVRGSERDPNTNLKTETGITVNYDPENDAVELGVRDFAINLIGAVRGTATVSRLLPVTIQTESDYIEGLSVLRDAVPITPPRSIRSFDFQGTGFTTTIDGETATLTFAPTVDPAQIRDIVRAMTVGSQGGLDIVYDSANNKLRFANEPLTIRLIGAVQGEATVDYGSSGDGTVTIVTSGSNGTEGGGLEVRDEYGAIGQSVTSINFVGGGVTSSVSVDGQVATVFIPNSPGNEDFLLIGEGSDNVPNARRLVAGTGVTMIDGGPGGNVVISADSDAILGRVQWQKTGEFVTERAAISIESTQQIIAELTDDPSNERAILRFYSLADGWYRPAQIDCGLIDDKYGNSIDLGTIRGGIIEVQANLGDVIPNYNI